MSKRLNLSPEEEQRYYKERYGVDRAKKREYQREYYVKNREKILARMAEWRRLNPDRQSKWLEENPSYHRDYERTRRLENDEYRLRQNENRRQCDKQLRAKVLEKYGSCCARCQITDIRVLQIDHTNGGGSKELMRCSLRQYYNKVLSDTTGGYQVLCANCNWIKRCENNEVGNYHKEVPTSPPIRGHKITGAGRKSD